MRHLAHIQTVYAHLDDAFDREKRRLRGPAADKIEAAQVLNDQAYFLLCWGQLETEIDAACRGAIRRRRDGATWQVRRGWDLYNPDDARLSGLTFEDRVKLVLDQREGRGSPYAKTLSHYGIRNRIAHGKLESTRVNVVEFIEDCFVIQAALHRAA